MRTPSLAPVLAAFGGLVCLPVIQAGEAPAAAAPKESSIYDDLWALTTLYSNKESAFLQELKLTGRAHLDLYGVDADQGDASDADVRRLRFGLKAKIANSFTIHVEADTSPEDPNPFYRRLTEANISWSPDKSFKLIIGKHGNRFTLDGRTSSNVVETMERSNIANNLWFPDQYMPGVSISGEKGPWSYNIGVFSNGSPDPEFGDFEASWTALAGFGYDFAEALGADKAILGLDLVYQDPTTEATFTRPNESVAALHFDYKEERFGFAAEVAASTGYGSQSDLFGIMIRPSYEIIEKKLQAVLRYTYMSSEDPKGIRLGRYEREVVSGRGDEYHEFYAGLNYYIYGQKLKLMSGVTYTMMDDSSDSGGDYDGIMGVVGLRMSW